MLPYLMRHLFFSFSPAKLIHFPPMLASASQLHANYTGNEMYTQCMLFVSLKVFCTLHLER